MRDNGIRKKCKNREIGFKKTYIYKEVKNKWGQKKGAIPHKKFSGTSQKKS